MNPFARLISLPIRFYRRFISPMKPPCCRFTPTCSEYALEALAEWGVIRGLGLALWRVLRCNPYAKGGYDPVPVNRARRRRLEARRNRAKRDSPSSASDDLPESFFKKDNDSPSEKDIASGGNNGSPSEMDTASDGDKS